jgi:dipeptidyl aminopeptidase/acylaminoacyl peptidase
VTVILLSMATISATAQDAPSNQREGKIYAPAFSPSDRSLVAYERQVGDTRELFLYETETGDIQQITARQAGSDSEGGALQGFFGTDDQDLRLVEGQLAWRPILDANGRQWFVFVSSEGEQGYGLYLSYVTPEGKLGDRVVPLAFDGQAGLPDWSPDGDQIVFSGSTSESTGYDLYLFPDLEPFFSDESSGDPPPVQLTDHTEGALHPTWSPDGRQIAYQTQEQSDGTANWGINLLDMTTWAGPSGEAMPRSVRMTGALDMFNEYKPSWSPSGRYISFYVTQSEVGSGSENRQQDIAVLLRETGPEGRVLGGRLLSGYSGQRLARNVLVNESRGPEWYPSADEHSIIYVQREEEAGNPIYLADVTRWNSNEANFARSLSERFASATRLHEEVSTTLVPGSLRLAFSSQVGDNLRLQVQDVDTPGPVAMENLQIRQEQPQGGIWRSVVFPGWGQLQQGHRARGFAFGSAAASALATAVISHISLQTEINDYNRFIDCWWTGKREVTPCRENPYYENTSTKDAKLLNLINDRADRVSKSRSVRNVSLAAFAAIWAWSVVDSILKGDQYSTRTAYSSKDVKVSLPQVSTGKTFSHPSIKLSLTVNF